LVNQKKRLTRQTDRNQESDPQMAEQGPPCPCWADQVNTHLQGQLIYKDECTKCFLTPKDEHGLNISMKTFLGFCCNPAPGHNHTEAYFARTGHSIFMNLKLTPKAQTESGEEAPQKITKLAIGKPGGIDADTDKYDQEVTVICKRCQCTISLEHP